jgi:hypothetical protein
MSRLFSHVFQHHCTGLVCLSALGMFGWCGLEAAPESEPDNSPTVASSNTPSTTYAHDKSGKQSHNSYFSAGLTGAYEQRAALRKKLRRIQIPEVGFDATPMSEVVRWLQIETKRVSKADPKLNFLLNLQPVEAPTTNTSSPGSGNPNVEISAATVTIRPSLKNLTLEQTLDVICKMADQPIGYSAEDYTVVFRAGRSGTGIRIYSVPANTFQHGLQSVGSVNIAAPNGQSAGGGGNSGVIVPRVNPASGSP